MRITKKIISNIDVINNAEKSKSKKQNYNNQMNNDNKMLKNVRFQSPSNNQADNQSLILNKIDNNIPIKVSLNKNNNDNYTFYVNNHQRLYTTKTADSKSLYIKASTSKLMNENNLKNKPKNLPVSPSSNNEKNNNNNKEHKIRDLLSNKFTYNKPKTNQRQFSQKTYSSQSELYDIKTFNNKLNNNDDNISIVSGYTNKINKNYNNNLIDVKLDDLILYEERLNDIIIGITHKNNNNYDGDASNECAEFLVFYFHSSLKGIFIYFFKEDKSKEIIQSANNLFLLMIIIIYHLSLSPHILKDVVSYFNKILLLMKMNLYLIVKQLQLFKGENFVRKNNFYFKTFNVYLQKQNLLNFSNEESIIQKITQNCRIITTEVKNVLKIYLLYNDPFYEDFSSLFNNLSIITEVDINSYFFQNLYGFNLKKNKNVKQNNPGNYTIRTQNNNINDNNNEKIKEDDLDNSDVISIKSSKSSNYYGQINQNNDNKIGKIVTDYEKIKVSPPYLKTPNNKKYTLVLDLDETLINVEIQDIENNKYLLHLRPGLFSFLSAIKPYYELGTFTSASKQYAEPIIKEIEKRNKYFDFNFYREHSVICGNDFVKDISRIGRDIRTIIIVDNSENNFRLNKENGIKIAPFNGNKTKNDIVLFELKKILILIYKTGYNDLRVALKDFAYDIKTKVCEH